MPAPERDDSDSALDADTVAILLAWQDLEIASRRTREFFAGLAGISLTDFQALVFLSEQNGMSPKEMGADLGLSTGAMTALIDRLEAAGYAERNPHPTDRRSTRLDLTTTGRHAVAGAGRRYADVLLEVVPQGDRADVGRLFARLAADLDERRSRP
jgi:DNA-binding MarR family transcriptional regulator